MSSLTLIPSKSTNPDNSAKGLGNGGIGDVVEIGLLLPTPWANALMELSRTRDQSVGQIVRSMIAHGLGDVS